MANSTVDTNNMKKRLVLIISFGILAILIGFFVVRTQILSTNLEEANQKLAIRETNDKVIFFTQLFIEKVIKSGSEVNFETRLKLENAVRDIKDDEILAAWNKFVESKTEADAQNEVKELLTLLVQKIKI